jgi:hypothetical protein
MMITLSLLEKYELDEDGKIVSISAGKAWVEFSAQSYWKRENKTWW